MKLETSLMVALVICTSGSFAGTEPAPVSKKTAPVSNTAAKAKSEMRKLWQDHVVFMRSYLVSATSDSADTHDAANRLLQNQGAIVTLWTTYYGESNARKIGILLRDHVMISADIIKAANANDKDRWSELQRKWEANARNMAAFLASTNPNWNAADLEILTQRYLELLGDQVSARMNQDAAADAKAYELAHNHMLRFADVLSDGIARQFPDRFAQATN
jgi:hypothetical protein